MKVLTTNFVLSLPAEAPAEAGGGVIKPRALAAVGVRSAHCAGARQCTVPAALQGVQFRYLMHVEKSLVLKRIEILLEALLSSFSRHA